MKTKLTLRYIINISFLISTLLIKQSKSHVYFNFPYRLSLSDGNILVIHQKGISICDSKVNRIIENIRIFEGNEEIKTEAVLSKVTSTFEMNYIICIINDKIYFFNDKGNLLFESNTILKSGQNPEYYTLVPIDLYENYYKYIVGFIYNKKIYLYYYKFNIASSQNTEITKIEEFNHSYNSYYIITSALTCKYMNKVSIGKVLVCFFNMYSSKYLLVIDYFKINEDSIQEHSQISSELLNFLEVHCLKSFININYTKALLIAILNNELYYYIVDINASHDTLSLLSFDSFKCKDIIYGTKIDYLYDKMNTLQVVWIQMEK